MSVAELVRVFLAREELDPNVECRLRGRVREADSRPQSRLRAPTCVWLADVDDRIDERRAWRRTSSRCLTISSRCRAISAVARSCTSRWRPISSIARRLSSTAALDAFTCARDSLSAP